MAFIHGKSAVVLHGAYDLSSYLNNGSASSSVDTTEVTAFGATSKSYVTGLKDATLSASGMFDGSAAAVDEVLTASIGSDTLAPITFASGGTTIGNRVVLLKGKTKSYSVTAPVGDVVSVSYEAQSDGGNDYGVSLHALGADTATVNNTAVDNAASTANGGLAQLHVTANSRSANATFKIQHSSDNTTFADLASFAVVATTVTTSERVTVAAGTTVNRYLRSQLTLASGTGSITYQTSFARR
jgi:hypothetical protein